MIHVADILLALFPGAWKAKQHACEAKSLLEALSLQMNLTMHLWKFVPIRKLPMLCGPDGRPRHTQDHHYKDEMLCCANKAGCGLTAQRITVALKIVDNDAVVGGLMESYAGPTPGSSSSDSSLDTVSAQGSSDSQQSSGRIGPQSLGSDSAPGPGGSNREDHMGPNLEFRLRDQTDYVWPVQASYLETMKEDLGPTDPHKPGSAQRG